MRILFAEFLKKEQISYLGYFRSCLLGLLVLLGSIAFAQTASNLTKNTNGTIEIILDNTVSMSGYCLSGTKPASASFKWLLKEIENFRAREYLSIRDSFLYGGELDSVPASTSPIYQFIAASESGKDCPRRIKTSTTKGQLKDEDTTRFEDVFVKIASSQQDIGILVTDFLIFGEDKTQLQSLARAHFEKLGVNGAAGVLMLRLPFVGNYYFDGSRQPTFRVLLSSSSRPISIFWWAKNPKLAASFLNQISTSYAGLKIPAAIEKKLPEHASIQVWPQPRVHPMGKTLTGLDILGDENTVFSVKEWGMSEKNDAIERKWYELFIDKFWERSISPTKYRFEACAPYSSWKKIGGDEFLIPVKTDGRCSDDVTDIVNASNVLPIQLVAQPYALRKGLDCVHLKENVGSKIDVSMSATKNCQIVVNVGRGAALKQAIVSSPNKRLSTSFNTYTTYKKTELDAVRAEISPWSSIKEPCLDQARPERETGINCNDRDNIDRVFDLNTNVENLLSAGQRAMESLSRRKGTLHFEKAMGQ